jgi:Phage gp6-like head-tail connector protein
MAAAMSGATVFFADAANEIATLTNVFKVNGVPTDATTATLTVTDPAGATSTPSVTHSGTGTYTATVPCTTSGVWLYKWVGTGTAADVVEGTFTVTTIDQTIYATVEEVKSRLTITDTTDDFELTLAVQAASRKIDQLCGRYFWRGTDTRTYIPESMFRQTIDDLVSVTTLKIDRDGDGVYEETWSSATDYALEVAPGRYNTASKGEPWPYTGIQVINSGRYFPYVWPWRHLDAIQVTGVFGWPAVPPAVKHATLIAAADLFKLKDAPFGVAGVSDLGLMRVGNNPEIFTLLDRYMRGQRVGV